MHTDDLILLACYCIPTCAATMPNQKQGLTEATEDERIESAVIVVEICS